MEPHRIILYVHPVFSEDYNNVARRFVDTYKRFPAGASHKLWVICNGGVLSPQQKAIYAGTNPVFMSRDNTGWDVGAFLDACTAIVESGVKCDMVMCCGSNTHFKRAGWLRRLSDVWDKNGPGMYGVTASYEIRPHFNTSSFVCPPKLVADYPFSVTCMEDRYHFEWGSRSLMRQAESAGMPVLLVTWDGEYPVSQFRKARNGYRNGDQSGCLAYFRHSDTYDAAPQDQRFHLAEYADGLRSNTPEIHALRMKIDSLYG